VRIEPGFGGAQISLADRFWDPCDDQGEAKAAWALLISAEGDVGDGAKLDPGKWQTLQFTWNGEGSCAVEIDGKPAAELSARGPLTNGISYLRLRSLASQIDPAGFFVHAVAVKVH
jgi:hypothetical protein